MSKKYQNLYMEWQSSHPKISFYEFLDKRRDERKAMKKQKIEIPFPLKNVESTFLEQVKKYAEGKIYENLEIPNPSNPETSKSAMQMLYEKSKKEASEKASELVLLDMLKTLGHDYTPHPWSEPVPEDGYYLAFHIQAKAWANIFLPKADQHKLFGYSHWMHMPPVPEST